MLKYAFALAMVAVAVLLRYAMVPLAQTGLQFVTVFQLLIIVALVAGRWPAVLYSVIASPITAHYFTAEVDPGVFASAVLVILTAFISGWLTERLHTALDKSQKYADALAQSETRFRGTFENAAVGMTLLGLDGNWFAVNRRFCEMMGYSREALVGSSFVVVTHPDDFEDDFRRFDQLRQGALDSYSVTKRYVCKDGRIIWVDLYRALQRDQSGKPLYTIAVVLDITDRKRAEEALQESEEKFRLLAENARAVIGIVQGEHFIYVNPYMEELSGYTRDEVLQIPIGQMVHPESRATVLDRARRRQMGEPVETHYEFAMLTKSGEKRWIDFSVNAIHYRGRPAITGIGVDITDRKRIEETLAASEVWYRQTLESIPGMVFTTRPDGYCDYQSSQWVRYTGVPMEQMLGDGWNKLLHPDDRPRAFAAWRAAVEERAPYDLEYRVRRYDGEYEWFKVRGAPIRNAKGKIVRWFGVAANISDLKNVENALRESERRFRDLADSMPQIVWASSPDGTVDYYNRKWKEVTGVDLERTGDQSWMPVLHPDDRQRTREVWMDAVTSGKPYYTELRLLDVGKNEYRWYIARALPIRDEQGSIVRWFGTATDVHDLKQAQEKLAALKIDLENKNKEMESFIGIVSHDLRAPIVNIRGFSHEVRLDCQMIDKLLAPFHLEQKLDKQLDAILHKSIPESISYIETSSEAMSSLVKTLVEVARAGIAPLKPEKVDMNKLINQVIESIKIRFKDADVRFDLSPLPDCYADRTQVTQIFTNLVDNAVKYLDSSRPGWVCIEGVPQVDGVLYWVSDNGIGISVDEQEKIFDPYYQLKEKAAGGVGMGLATVKRLVERNNGKVWVVSEKDQYSVFYVALPAHEPDRSFTLAGEENKLTT